MSSLTQIIKSKEATIGIIGLGYVGLPLAIRFSEVGFKVVGFFKGWFFRLEKLHQSYWWTKDAIWLVFEK